MQESVDGSPAVQIPRNGIGRACVGQEFDLHPGGSQGDGLLLKINLGALVMRIRKGAHQKESHRLQ